jgi:hypothetical protein
LTELQNLSTDLLAISGGDDRLALDAETGLNIYGCSARPRPVIGYSSSTASSISAAAFELVRARHSQLAARLANEDPADVYAESLEVLRTRLRGLYRLPADIDVLFTPSGTDLELPVLALALAGPEKRVTNVLVGEDEVGSGCVYSAAGQHFRKSTAHGAAAVVGEPIAGFEPERIRLAKVEVRRPSGLARPAEAIYEDIVAAVDAALAGGDRAIVHVVHRSKTGIVVPTWEQVEALAARFGNRVDLVIDACQGRISPDNLAGYLAMGASVMVTGSKFIAGPPFSGMLFVPPGLAARAQAMEVSKGLSQYAFRAEWPQGWRAADSVLPKGASFGLLLRLEAAIYELQRLAAVPDERLLAVVKAFGESVRAFTERSPRFSLFIAAEGLRPQTHIDHPFERDMLFTVQVVGTKPDGRPLDIDDAKQLYHQLYTDLSDRFDNPADKAVAREICHVGQPVKCLKNQDGTTLATLRLSLSAPLISCLAGIDDEALAARFAADFDRIAAKVELLLR